MNYGGSVSQRPENVGRYILRNIPILWAAPRALGRALSSVPSRRGENANFRCNAAVAL